MRHLASRLSNALGVPQRLQSPMTMTSPRIIDATLSIGQQARLFSRLTPKDGCELAAALDGTGVAALDVISGPTCEALLSFFKANPFEVVAQLHAAAPHTPLMATLAGGALLRYHQCADDLVTACVQVLRDSGVSVIRAYDPLNDLRNLSQLFTAAKSAGVAVDAMLVYNRSPVHTHDYFSQLVAQLVASGATALTLWDPSGALSYAEALSLVGMMAATQVPVGVRVSDALGLASVAVLGAVQGGATTIDAVLPSLSGGPSLLSVDAITRALPSDCTLSLKMDGWERASAQLDDMLGRYEEWEAHPLRTEPSALSLAAAPALFWHLHEELEAANAPGRYREGIKECERIAHELGYPPLVSPFAEMVASQAVRNLTHGDRYAMVGHDVRDYCLGLYGSPPGPIAPSVASLVNGKEQPITCRPSDLIDPEVEAAKAAVAHAKGDPNDPRAMVACALYPDAWRTSVAPPPAPVSAGAALDTTTAPEVPATPPPPSEERRTLTVEVDGEEYSVVVRGAPGTFGGGSNGGGVAVAAASLATLEGAVVAPMQGVIVKVVASVGMNVTVGDVVAILEAMKMQNEITAHRSGTVTHVAVSEGSVVGARDAICTIGT